jgi:hypothetical protein
MLMQENRLSFNDTDGLEKSITISESTVGMTYRWLVTWDQDTIMINELLH